MHFLRKLFFVIMFVTKVFSSYSQTFDTNTVNNFQIGIFTSWYNYFDGNPMIQTSYSNTAPLFTWLSNSKGIDIVYFHNTKNAFRLSFDDVEISYLKHVTGPRTGYPGYIFERNMVLLKFEYLKKLLDKKNIELFIKGGTVYRYGSGETALASYGNIDVLVDISEVNDFGFTIGAHSIIPIYKTINAIIIISYNNYVYRKDTGNDSPYYWDSGSSKQSFSISVGIGYQFRFNN